MATMTLDDLVTQLRAAYGERLAAAVLYGSAATGENVAKRSDFNVLVLLDHVDDGALAAASSAARAWQDAGNPPPMTMTVEEWQRSADVFPMEYADILERHRVLHGEPHFGDTEVDPSNLRLQLEQQVMGKLLQLRQGALLAGTDVPRQLELVSASLSTILVLFRAVMRLRGERPGADAASVIGRVAALTGIDGAPFLRASAHVRDNAKLTATSGAGLLSSYLGGVQALHRYLDRYADPA